MKLFQRKNKNQPLVVNEVVPEDEKDLIDEDVFDKNVTLSVISNIDTESETGLEVGSQECFSTMDECFPDQKSEAKTKNYLTSTCCQDKLGHLDFDSAKDEFNESLTKEESDPDYIVVTIPDIKDTLEMTIHPNADPEFYRDDEILHVKDMSKSPYRYFLMVSGLISSPLFPANSLKFGLQKVMIYIFMLWFLVLEFGALFDLNVLVIEKRFPFTVINNIIWEMRWILTYFLTKSVIDANGLREFLKGIRISRGRWRKNAHTMKKYVAFVFIITVIAPCTFAALDLNFLNVDKIKGKKNPIVYNVIYTIFVFIYRIIMVPCFCLLSTMLYLLGDHVRRVGKEINSQRSCKDVHNLVKGMRTLIRSTEKSLQKLIMVHMLLIFCTSFTTAMSTLERLEFTYSTNNGNHSSSKLELHVVDVQPNRIPISELVNLKMDFNKMQDHFDLLTSNSKEEREDTLSQEKLNKAYSLISNVQQKQIHLLEAMLENNNNPRNISVQSKQQVDPSTFYNVILSIKDSYTKLRVILDSVMTLIEILLLYMSPLILIIRTDYMLRDTVGDVWDINIGEQQENGLAITNYGSKEHILDHLKNTEGFRVCGYKVEFFKTLILASFGPFFAIALRATWKHFGFY